MESLKPVNYCFVFLQERHGLPNPPSSQTLAVNKTISQTYSYSYSMNSSLSHAAPPILMPLIVFQWINHNWKTIVFLLFASLISEQHSLLYAVLRPFRRFMRFCSWSQRSWRSFIRNNEKLLYRPHIHKGKK